MESWRNLFRFERRPIRLWPNQAARFGIQWGEAVPPKFVRERLMDARKRLQEQRLEQQPPTDFNPEDLSPSPVGSFPPDSSDSSEQKLEIETL